MENENLMETGVYRGYLWLAGNEGMEKKMETIILGFVGTIIRWILKILHDPKNLIPWERWYYSILGSCRIFSINSRDPFLHS